ncbi:MAG: 4Fe-4S binding protein [Planctomycetota bacterium]|jgi:electron transport complex protein RnfB
MPDKTSSGISRRSFLKRLWQVVCTFFLGGIIYRIFFGKNPDAVFDQPATRFAWQIDHTKCTFCGTCATACVRKPSAVKAVNDQKKCSFCVACYGHLQDTTIESDKLLKEGIRVCPRGAVKRENYTGGLDGYYIYSIDDTACVGCGMCAKRCNDLGTRSMFLIIRPDLCVSCNQCDIALSCPSGAIERVPISSEDNYRGEYGFDNNDMFMMDMGNEG